MDGASQVLKVPVSTIEAAPGRGGRDRRHCIRGVAKLTERLIILMDLHKILALELREGAARPVTELRRDEAAMSRPRTAAALALALLAAAPGARRPTWRS